ncbi:MAG: hypothetical protein ABIS14_02780 [Sphingomonas sp.]
MRRFIPIIALTGLASCVAPPPPAPRPAPPPAYIPPPPPQAAPPLASDWRDWPVTPGEWAYRREGRGYVASFGSVGADALLTLRCDPQAGQMSLARRDVGGGPGAVTIRTTSTQRTLMLQPGSGTPSVLTAAIMSRDPLLDAIAFSRGRFTLEQAGQAPLVIPVQAEIDRVIEDCRG